MFPIHMCMPEASSERCVYTVGWVEVACQKPLVRTMCIYSRMGGGSMPEASSERCVYIVGWVEVACQKPLVNDVYIYRYTVG